MQRVTITVEDELLDQVDEYASDRGYSTRSEAMRDLVRAGLTQWVTERGDARECVAALVYVYDHSARELARRLTHTFHEHHDLTLASLHVHLDHASCLEVAVLRGGVKNVRQFGSAVVAERGVAHGQLVLVPVDVKDETHEHGAAGPHAHVHTRVRSG